VRVAVAPAQHLALTTTAVRRDLGCTAYAASHTALPPFEGQWQYSSRTIGAVPPVQSAPPSPAAPDCSVQMTGGRAPTATFLKRQGVQRALPPLTVAPAGGGQGLSDRGTWPIREGAHHVRSPARAGREGSPSRGQGGRGYLALLFRTGARSLARRVNALIRSRST
jgi:hypothetical protein